MDILINELKHGNDIDKILDTFGTKIKSINDVSDADILSETIFNLNIDDYKKLSFLALLLCQYRYSYSLHERIIKLFSQMKNIKITNDIINILDRYSNSSDNTLLQLIKEKIFDEKDYHIFIKNVIIDVKKNMANNMYDAYCIIFILEEYLNNCIKYDELLEDNGKNLLLEICNYMAFTFYVNVEHIQKIFNDVFKKIVDDDMQQMTKIDHDEMNKLLNNLRDMQKFIQMRKYCKDKLKMKLT